MKATKMETTRTALLRLSTISALRGDLVTLLLCHDALNGSDGARTQLAAMPQDPNQYSVQSIDDDGDGVLWLQIRAKSPSDAALVAEVDSQYLGMRPTRIRVYRLGTGNSLGVPLAERELGRPER